MRKFGLIGYPLSHTFSPIFFAEKFLKEKISGCEYSAYPIENMEAFPGLLKLHPELEGINVTIPYKKRVIPFLHRVSDEVAHIKACNCIKIKNGKLIGYNTDISGFKISLLPLLKPHHKKALILGTGGVSLAVEYVLQQLEIEFLFVSRSRSANTNCITYSNINEEVLSNHTLIINTSPVGMYPNDLECPYLPYQWIDNRHYFFDMVYNPAKTLFLQKGEECGAAIKNGAEMLIIQAEESWKIWNDDNY